MDNTLDIPPKEFRKSLYRRFVIVADIGGTNTRMAVMGVRTPREIEIIFKRTILTSELKTIASIINETLEYAKKEYDIESDTACIAAAGPIKTTEQGSFVRLTNTDLEIDTATILPKTLLKHIILANDFEAIGYGLDFLDPERDLVRLDTSVEKIAINRTGTMAIIGAGTGLGIGIVPYNKELHLHTPFPSEGGHTDFTPYNLQELELVHYLQTNHMTKEGVHPEIERVLSGAGILAIYDYLLTKSARSTISKRIIKLSGNDKIKLICDNAVSDPVCRKTVELFIRFYARAARTVVLLSEPFSGLFIAGGIAQKHPEWMKSKTFLDEFFRQDRRLDLLQNTPLYLITNPDIGLYGCCNVAINFS